MVAVRQAVAAALLVAVTLCLQCAGMAILIRWTRTFLMRSTVRMNQWRSSVLMIRFTIGMIVLHTLQITAWASFYRWQCLPSWGILSVFFRYQLLHGWLWRRSSAASLAPSGSNGKRHWRAYVRHVCQRAIRHRASYLPVESVG